MIAALMNPKRVRVAGLVAAATDARIVSAKLVGPSVSGAKLSIELGVTSSSGGLVTCSGVLAYPSQSDNVVIGHFAQATAVVPPGGTALVEMHSLGPISPDYVGQNLELLFSPDSSLGGVTINTPVSQLTPGWTTYVAISKGSLTSSPYFLPALVTVGVLGTGALVYELAE